MGRTEHRLITVVLVLAGCGRAPLDFECPALSPGELAVTELRGPQPDEADRGGQWIELWNTSGQNLDLRGLRLELARLDGTGTAAILVRTGLEVAPGSAVVLGRHPAKALPAHVDYGFEGDFDGDLYPAGVVRLLAREVEVDQVVFRSLPASGSWAFDGAKTPDARANDDLAAWCQDATGSPGEGNPPCH